MSAEAFGTVLIVVGIALAALILALFALGLAWVYRDAQARDGMGCLWTLLVFLAGPLGILIYALLRQKSLEADS